jgi:DNA-binding beta-propeller fold protein YncE
MLRPIKLRRLALAGVGTLCVTLGALSLAAVPASAMLSFPFDGQIAPASGSFGRTEPGGQEVGTPALGGVAINDFNGETYVAEVPTGEAAEKGRQGAVFAFDSAGGELARLDPTLTPAGSFGVEQLPLAANNSTGEVYVLDFTHDAVDVFDSTGAYICQITGAAAPSLSECNGPAGSDTPAHGFFQPLGIAVDQATGEVYVLDAQHGVIDVFSVAGAYQRQIELAQIPGGFQPEQIRGLAASAFNGHVFVVDTVGGVVHEFDAAGTYVTTWTGENTPAGSFGGGEPTVAAEDTNGNVYVTSSAQKVTDVFDSTGTYLSQFGHSYHIPRATAVDQANGEVYVSDAVGEGSSPQVVDIFGPGVIVPDVTTLAADNVEAHSATLHGALNPDETQLSDCRFEYGTDISYGQNVPCVPAAGSIPPDGEEHQVSAEIAGLHAGTTYHFRLVAANAAGSNAGSDETLSTLPGPAIDSTAAKNLTGTTAELTAEINPEGADTTYRFEWGPTNAYGNSVPEPDQDIGSQTGDVAVAQEIGGLEPNETYHWRVVATNSRDTTTGVDHSFTYSAALPALPDGRAYEMVTPPAKNGALISGGLLQAAPDVSSDGSRVMLASIQCFAESPSCTAERKNEGEPFSFSRTTAGWQTTALAPPPTQVNGSSNWRLSASTGTALFTIPTQPGEQDDFYAREPDGSFVDMGPVTEPARGPLGSVFADGQLGGTEGFQHIAFETKLPAWSFDTSEHFTAYDLNGPGNAAPELVGVSGAHGSTSLISNCATQLGTVGNNHWMSSDGSSILFIAAGHDRSECAIGTTAPPVDELYARLNNSTTVAISRASSLDCTTPACTKAPPSDGKLEDASADGTKVFFTDTQQLTDAASKDSQPADTAGPSSGCLAVTGANGCNLYEYDFGLPAGHRLIAVSAGDTSGLGPEVQRVMAVSADGSHVYFVAHGVLSDSANDQGTRPLAGGENLYVFERDTSHPAGHTAFVATLSRTDREESADSPPVPSVTPDGRFLVFTSHDDLTSDDDSASGAAQVFRYDAQEERLVRISIGERGFNDNGNTFQEGLCELQGATCPRDASIARPTDPTRRDPTMSNDGSYVFFRSPVGLTPQALNDVRVGVTQHGAPLYAQNVYEYHDGHVSVISDGKDTTQISGVSAVELLSSDETGANVFFSTADQLVNQDTDTQRDFYDARICTAGSPCISPAAPPLPPCLGEACHGTPAATPSLVTPGTASFNGAGNQAPPPILRKPKTAAQIRAEKLAKGLKFCRAKHDKRKRAACEAHARKRYGPKGKPHLRAKSKSHKGGK